MSVTLEKVDEVRTEQVHLIQKLKKRLSLQVEMYLKPLFTLSK